MNKVSRINRKGNDMGVSVDDVVEKLRASSLDLVFRSWFSVRFGGSASQGYTSLSCTGTTSNPEHARVQPPAVEKKWNAQSAERQYTQYGYGT